MSTKLERQEVRDALTAIFERDGGNLTPDAVVEAAKNKSNPLHDLFDWGDKSAAHKWRLEQARELIGRVKIEYKTEHTTITAVAYVRNPDCAAGEQGYVSVIDVAGDKDRARAVLIAEFSRAAAALRRARELAVVFAMENDVDVATTIVNTMKTKVETQVSVQ